MSRRVRNERAELSLSENTFKTILTEWALSRFEWSGLPSHVKPIYLEKELLMYGETYLYLSKYTGRLEFGRATVAGNTDRYDEPIFINIVSYKDRKSERVEKRNFVRIKSSLINDATTRLIREYSGRLANAHRSLDLVSRAMRVNRIAVADEDTKLTVENILQQIDVGTNFIRVQQGFNLEQAINTIDLAVDPRILPALRDEANNIWGDFLSFLGVNNMTNDKKERLISAEAFSSSGQVSAARVAALKSRQMACDEANGKFGIDMSVRWALDDERVTNELYNPIA